jgi:PAT family acetyl-CoA transporter-like MFS transporter 1
VPLKLIEYGVPNAVLSLLVLPLGVANVIWPFVLSKYTARFNQLMLFYTTMCIKFVYFDFFSLFQFDAIIDLNKQRLCFLVLVSIFVIFTPRFKDKSGEYPLYFYCVYLIIMIVGGVLETTSWVSCMGFSAQTSDPRIGGTYLCLMNTISNLGYLY